MDQVRSTLALVTLAGATLAAALAGPRLGGPDPTIMIAILFASLTSSIAGFAFSAVCGGILFHLSDDHVRMVDLMIACSIANQAAMVWSLRREIAWRSVGVVIAGGLCGVPLGAWVLLHIDRAQFGYGMGAVLLAYGAYLPLSIISRGARAPCEKDDASSMTPKQASVAQATKVCFGPPWVSQVRSGAGNWLIPAASSWSR